MVLVPCARLIKCTEYLDPGWGEGMEVGGMNLSGAGWCKHWQSTFVMTSEH